MLDLRTIIAVFCLLLATACGRQLRTSTAAEAAPEAAIQSTEAEATAAPAPGTAPTSARARSTKADDASGFVVLADVIPEVILEIRYYSTYNFIGERIPGYEQPTALLTKEAAEALKAVSDELLPKGYRLKIFDAYRPQCAVDRFMAWAKDLDDVRMKPYFYPEIEKPAIIPSGYVARRSGHTRGSTVDLTLFDMRTEREVDMGCTYDYFGRASHPGLQPGETAGAYKPITAEQYRNRMILRSAMMVHGFKPVSTEWWHFTLRNEPYPDTYFTFPVNECVIR